MGIDRLSSDYFLHSPDAHISCGCNESGGKEQPVLRIGDITIFPSRANLERIHRAIAVVLEASPVSHAVPADARWDRLLV